MAFLKEIEMILRHKGFTYDRESLHGGGPQGTKLGLYLFIVLINGAGMKYRDIVRNLGEIITKPLNSRKPIKTAEETVDNFINETKLLGVMLRSDMKWGPM